MKKGSSVVIIGTDNVRAKTPHLIGRIGIIYEAPVHPATWYKVEVNDEILTFRPSALRTYNGNETHVSAAYLDTYQKELLKEKQIKNDKVNRAKTGLRYNNSTKKEKKGYQRKINNSLLSTLNQRQWINTEVRDSQGMLCRVSNVLENGDVIVTSSIDGAEKLINSNQLTIMRSMSDDDSDNEGNETESADDESIDDIFPSGKRSRKISTIIHRKRNISQEKYRRSLLPSASDIDLVQNIMKTIMSPEFEKEAVHEFMTACCQTCFSDKWSGARFCWNENCITSPIYWKRTGCRGNDSITTNDKRPTKFIESLQENMEINNIISIPVTSFDPINVEIAQTPNAIPNVVTIECYRPINNSDHFIHSYHSKARSDSNVTDAECFSTSFSPLPKCDDYSEDEIDKVDNSIAL